MSTRNLQRILRRYVKPGDRVLEFGFAPGKMLVWVAKVLGAQVTGIDYSEIGVGFGRQVFEALKVEADLRCTDAFSVSLPEHFDLVYSTGLIEHFDDPREIVRRHVLPLRPGGVALITIPNFGGIYGHLERWFDPAILGIHNLDIMSVEALREVAPPDLTAAVRTFRYGRLDPSLINWNARWPRSIAAPVSLVGKTLGLVQPFDIPSLCPYLVLEITRAMGSSDRAHQAALRV